MLVGTAIRDNVLRDAIRSFHDAEPRLRGRRYSDGRRELKGSLLLKKEVFRPEALNSEVHLADMPTLACAALDDCARADVLTPRALALAKLRYAAAVIDICADLRCHAAASMVETDA